MVNIHMTEECYNNLLELSKTQKEEVGGIIQGKANGNDLLVDKISIHSDDVYQERTSSSLEYNVTKWIQKTVWDLFNTDIPYYIMFHTHPRLTGAPRLSAADVETLQYVKSLANKVPHSNNIEVIEGIITRHEIAFYHYDTNKKEPERLPLFVNGIERKPSTEQGLVEAFKNGFIRGRKR